MIAPLLATLMQPIQLAPAVVERLDYAEVTRGLTDAAAMLLLNCGFALGAFPLFCRIRPVDHTHVRLHDWLAARQRRNHELHIAFSSSSFRWFLWNSFASVAPHVHALTGGFSAACRCEVPGIASEGSMESFGPLIEVQEDTLLGLHSVLENVGRGLRDCYLVLPGEGVIKHLLQHQKEMMDSRQQEELPSRSSSSRCHRDPPLSPGCFWFLPRVPGHALSCERLNTEEVVPEEVVTLEQLQLMINMMLLLWPRDLTGASAATAAVTAKSAAARATGAGGSIGASAEVQSGTGVTAGTAADSGSTGGAGTSAQMPQPAAATATTTAAGAAKGGNGPPQAAPAVPADGLPQFVYEGSCTGMLLLLAALLQQAPGETKQQLMQQEEGGLLLQLLYRVLQDQQDAMALNAVQVQPYLQGVLDGIIHNGMHNLLEAAAGGLLSHASPVSLLELVLLVLQSLLFVGDPWEAISQQGREQLLGMNIQDGKYA